MIITYFILLILAITFKMLHFPGASLIFLVSILFPFIDILIQSISKKENKETRIVSAVAVSFLALYLLFKFQYWPGSTYNFALAILISAYYLFRVFQQKTGFGLRPTIITLLFLFAIFNQSMSRSSFRMFYLPEDPFNEKEMVPDFIIQSFAYNFYVEGEYDKAEQLISRNINHLIELQADERAMSYERKIDQLNLEQSQKDLENIKNRTWNNFEPLIPEDRHLPN
jgi:hypothetical protein